MSRIEERNLREIRLFDMILSISLITGIIATIVIY